MQALAEAPIYLKQGRIEARPAILDEEITTTLKNGINETHNRAKEGDYIVTNPGGEQYIVPGNKFLSRYEPTDEEGIFTAKGYCRAILNPFGRPIEVMASWDRPEYGDQHCLIADICDASGHCDGEPYLIDAAVFAETYTPVGNR